MLTRPTDRCQFKITALSTTEVCARCSRAPEGGQNEGYYYTPMTYHCYQMGPLNTLAGCSVKQGLQAIRGSLFP